MRPRTKLQKIVDDLSKRLPDITEKQKQWAFEHCFKPEAYSTKKSAWCSLCGGSFEHNKPELSIVLETDDYTICPHCGKKLKLKMSRRLKDHEAWYYTVLTTKSGFQICRNFIVERSIRKGYSAQYWINEAFQNWISEDGKETIMARPCAGLSQVEDRWLFYEPMGIKERCRNPYRPDKYDVHSYFIYPGGNIIPKIKKSGYSRRLDGTSVCSLFKLLLTDREAEILAKNGQNSLLAYKSSRGYNNLPFNHSIRIANRNKYIIKDAATWYDYLRLLDYFRLDTHNAHYVCPKNLKLEHDKLLARKTRIEKKTERERQIAESRKWEAEYKETKGKFFGICFGNDDIVITVIQSVAEMAEEGEAMHHCVYKMGYYKKENSLILSAKDKKGKRIETIEIDLKTFKVVQSRSVNNGSSSQHEEIIRLCNNNMNLIQKAV